MASRFARPSRGRSRTGPRPNRTWADVLTSAFTVLPANSVVLHSVFVPSNPGIDETVLRTVGSVSIASDQTGASEEQIGAFGMALVTDSAVAIGVTAMPDPVSDAEDDGWFVYQAFAQQTALASTGIGSVMYPIDSKAKRILEGKGMNIAVMLTNSHATQGLQFAINLRLLSQVRGT